MSGMLSTLKEGFLMAGGSACAYLKADTLREVEALLFGVVEGKKAMAEPRRREARGEGEHHHCSYSVQ